MKDVQEYISQMDIPAKIEFIVSMCNASVTLSFNDHKDCYKKVGEYLKDNYIDSEILEKMIENDIIINMTFYPDSPVGNYNIYHYDLNMILDLSINLLFDEVKNG